MVRNRAWRDRRRRARAQQGAALASRGALITVASALAACGWLPPDSPPARPAAPDPDAAVLHAWKVTGHVLGPRPLISELDAAEFHGRTVAISPGAYSSPWSGACDDARRASQPRTLAQLAEHQQLAADRTASLELGAPITEYQLSCTTGRTPALTCYVAGAHAVTCWAGVCYLLSR